MKKHTAFTKGGAAEFANTETGNYQVDNFVEGFYGWVGAGGSVFQWHPELKISFAYVPTDFKLDERSAFNLRAMVLQGLVKQCVQEMTQ